jgi:hypothetical protein
MSIDKVVDAFCKQVAAGDDDDENFVCTDINGVKHDLRPSSYHITSKREGPHYRVNADYPPDEVAESGWEEVHRVRGADPIPIEFLVDEAEHVRMVRDGVLDEVEGQNVLAGIHDKALDLIRNRPEEVLMELIERWPSRED